MTIMRYVTAIIIFVKQQILNLQKHHIRRRTQSSCNKKKLYVKCERGFSCEIGLF